MRLLLGGRDCVDVLSVIYDNQSHLALYQQNKEAKICYVIKRLKLRLQLMVCFIIQKASV